MANTVIQLKKSATPGSSPTSLANGEIGINYADGVIYYKASNGSIASISSGTPSFGTINAAGTLLIADAVNDVLDIRSGDNITITGDAINDRLTIAASLTPANNWANTKLSNGSVTLAGALTTTGSIYANGVVYVTPVGGQEGGEIKLQATGTNTNWNMDSYQNNFRVFAESGTTVSNVNFFHAVGGSIRMGVNKADPAYTVDVSGDVNITGTYRVNGSPFTGDLTPANNWANTINTAIQTQFAAVNNYTISVGAASNNWANTINTAIQTQFAAVNNYTISVGAASNNWANTINTALQTRDTAGNNYTISVGAASNNWANSVNTYSDSTYFKKTGGMVSGDVQITGNLNVMGNVTFTNTNSVVVSDPLLYLAGNNYTSDIVDIGIIANYVNSTFANVHTGIFRDSTSKEWFVFEGYSQEPVNNHIDTNGNNFTLSVLNTNIRTSNLILGGANAITTIVNNAAGANGWSNNINTAIQTQFPAVNNYTISVGAAANSFSGAMANSVNIAHYVYANATGTGANNFAGLLSNNSNNWANTKVSSVTGTSGRITSSGGTTPAIDLATAGAGAATYSSGISAVTVDAYGRVTSVTGSAGYVTSSGVTSVATGTGLTGGTITSTGTLSVDFATVATVTNAAAAFGFANGVSINAAAAFAHANASYATGNIEYALTNAAFATANAAFGAANGKVSSVTGTSGRITSSGGTTPAIDLASGVVSPTAATGGISALTVDTYGRVTAITGSAGYLTSSTGLANTSGISFNGNLFFPTGNVAIGSGSATFNSVAYRLYVNGAFAANTKSFVIDHPTKPNMKLQHGSLEGPENGVYVRGKINGYVINLPDYWTGLVDEDTITVQLTAIGESQSLYVVEVNHNKVIICGENGSMPYCYYTIYGERKDVDKLIVEY